MTRDPKRVSLVEWYQELVDRVFLNCQPPEKPQPAPSQTWYSHGEINAQAGGDFVEGLGGVEPPT